MMWVHIILQCRICILEVNNLLARKLVWFKENFRLAFTKGPVVSSDACEYWDSPAGSRAELRRLLIAWNTPTHRNGIRWAVTLLVVTHRRF